MIIPQDAQQQEGGSEWPSVGCLSRQHGQRQDRTGRFLSRAKLMGLPTRQFSIVGASRDMVVCAGRR